MNGPQYKIRLTSLAIAMLESIQDVREREKLRDRIDQLKNEPEKQGKSLIDNLAGLRSVRSVGQRYRIVYKGESRCNHRSSLRCRA